MRNKQWLYWFLFCAVLLAVMGCARTVTVKGDAGSELNMEIKFNGATNTTTASLNYYILFPKSGYNIASLAPLISGYNPYPWFDAPKTQTILPYQDFLRQTFVDRIGNLNASEFTAQYDGDFIKYYYTNYYSNWFDFVEISAGEVRMYNGPFPSNGTALTTTSNYSSVGYVNQQPDITRLSFSIPFYRFSHSYAKGENIYFFILTVSNYQVVDWMPRVGSIVNESNSLLPDPYPYDDDFSQNDSLKLTDWYPAVDIKSWAASVR